MVNVLQQRESLIFWVIFFCMVNLTGYQLFMAALPLASRILEKWFVGTLKTLIFSHAICKIPDRCYKKNKEKDLANLNSVPTENTQFPLPFTTFHRLFKDQSEIFHSCGSLLFIFQPLFPPRAWSAGQLPWRRLRGRRRQRWTAPAISPWNIYGSLVLWLHGFWQWRHVNVNRRSRTQPLSVRVQLLAGLYSPCCFYSFIHPSPPRLRLLRASAKSALGLCPLCVSSSHSGSNLISFAVSSLSHTLRMTDWRLPPRSAPPPHPPRGCWDGPPTNLQVCLPQ